MGSSSLFTLPTSTSTEINTQHLKRRHVTAHRPIFHPLRVVSDLIPAAAATGAGLGSGLEKMGPNVLALPALQGTSWWSRTRIAAIGPTTGRYLGGAGMKVDAEAVKPSPEALSDAMLGK
ncbi:hypothetical protein HK104_010821 [Borealophlyctis nickersoniae]|nr:hypothetical protein HK104_010821 [Borealophlyctis nickersoniae]